MGASVEIEDIPGYFPFQNDVSLLDLSRTLLTDLAGEDMILELPHGTGSTDLGDLSALMPVVQPYIGGATGGLHSALYSVTDPDTAYLLGGKFLAAMTYELLKSGAEKARSIIKNYKPYFASKEAYFQYADALFSKKIYPEQDLF